MNTITTNQAGSRNHLVSAFTLIFLGMFIFRIPLESWSIKVMWIAAWISILIGGVQLYRTTSGKGKIAAGLWLLSIVAGILCIPFEIIGAFAEGMSAISKMSGGNVSLGITQATTILKWAQIIGSCFYPIGCILFMFYPPTAKAKWGWGLLLFTSLSAISNNVLINLLFTTIQFIGFYLVLTNLCKKDQLANRRTGALFIMSAGFLYSLLILLNNDMPYIIISIVGLILWIIGVAKIRNTSSPSAEGTGMMLTYAIVMIVASILHILPGMIGDLLSVLIQIPAYIILAISFRRFAKSILFFGDLPCGMLTMNGLMYFCLLLSILYLIPLVGESISAMLFALVGIPCFIVGWKNALVAQLPQFSEEDSALQTNETDIASDKLIVPETDKDPHKVSKRKNMTKIGRIAIIVILLFGLSGLVGGYIHIRKSINNLKNTYESGSTTFQADHIKQYRIIYYLGLGPLETDFFYKMLGEENITEKDLAKWKLAAEKKDPWGAYIVAYMYLKRNEVNVKCTETARTYLNQEFPVHIDNIESVMAKINQKKTTLDDMLLPMAFDWFEKAASYGHPESMYKMASVYLNGLAGRKRDLSKYKTWLEKSAEAGYTWAITHLATNYFNGENGYEKNRTLYLSYIEKAASLGLTNAQFLAGLAYGFGIPDIDLQADFAKAIKWYGKAAEKGHIEAKGKLGLIYLKGSEYFNAKGDIAPDLEKAAHYLTVAAEAGYAESQYLLAGMYEEGNGFPKDIEKARYWYQKAAEQGDKAATKKLKELK